MLFQVYGDNAIYQWIGWILVFCCLIGANELVPTGPSTTRPTYT